MSAGIRGVLGAVVALASIALAVWLALRVAGWAAGPNVSDVGVAMYARGPLGLVAGLIAYGMGATLPIHLAARRLQTKVPWYVGIPVGMIALLLLAWGLLFTYG
ncbi:MAG TPA: hypothetical protein VNO30_44565 [Kofleriaceae bacterium]|nr:hypothetical protein [Kofleriaceae bacterium]